MILLSALDKVHVLHQMYALRVNMDMEVVIATSQSVMVSLQTLRQFVVEEEHVLLQTSALRVSQDMEDHFVNIQFVMVN